jgi:hypothetical protein
MIMRQYLLVSGFCAVLAACGSGGGGNPAVNTNPNAPQPTEKLGQFAANRTINLSAATLKGGGNTNSINDVKSSQEGFGTNVQLNYDAASNKYGLKIKQGGIDRTLAPVALSFNGANYIYSNETGSTTETLALVGWGVAPLNLSYVTYGIWGRVEDNDNSGSAEFAVAAGGVATTPADMPKTGSITYSAGYAGVILRVDTYNIFGGSGTVTADFATGKVESSFSGTSDFASNNFNFTSSASIASGANSYSGTATGAAGSLASGMTGTLSGGFFGPGAVETGGSFRLEGNDQKAVGAFVGSKIQQ